MLVGATSIIESAEVDDIWLDKEHWNVPIDISSLENIVDGLDGLDQEVSTMGTILNRAKRVTPERLSKIWSIDIETANRTIDLTSQYVKHTGSDHLKQKYFINDKMLWYKRIQSYSLMNKFQVTAKAISERGNRYMQLVVSDTGLMYVYPMKEKTESINAVKAFVTKIDVPTALIFDSEGTQRSKVLNKVAQNMCCPLKYLKRATQWGNLAKLYIGLL